MDEHDDDEDEDDDDDDDDIIMVPVKVEEDLEDDNNNGMLKASIDAASTPKHLVDVEIITRIDKRATIMARDAVVVAVIVIIDLLDISIVLFLFIIIIIWLGNSFYKVVCYSNSNSNTTLCKEGGRGS